MVFSTLRQRIADHIVNYYGWKTKRKIVIIESDDWGSIRMPSIEAFERMKQDGIPVDKSPYCKYDSLASEEDLRMLFDCLRKYRDSNGNHPAVTANTVVSNPDFDRIERDNFQTYHCESICKTFETYPRHKNCLELWKQGNADGLFHPQSHGKEHLNSTLWMELLQSGPSYFKTAFDNFCWGLSSDIYPDMKRSVQASFDMEDPEDIEEHSSKIRHGLQLFEQIFGYRSASFIANNYIWSEKLNRTLYEEGVEFLQGMKYQKLPIYENKKREMIRHHVGDKNELGQYYLVRNCTFEPSLNPLRINNIKECLNGISAAFFWGRPAIICSHRINYVGFLNADNRDRNLAQLHTLLSEIISRWPDVEFMTSDKLGRVIKEDDEGEI